MATTSGKVQSMEELGFTKLAVKPSTRVIWLVAGPAKTGKSHLLYSMPGPLAYFNIDRGEEGTIEKFLEPDEDSGRTALTGWNYDVNITREMIADPNTEVVKAKCEPMFMSTLRAFDKVLMGPEGDAIRSIGVDTWTEFFQLGCFARIGKDKQIMPVERTKVNGIFSAIIHSAFYKQKNVMLLAKTTEFDGAVRIAGYNQSEALVQTVIMTGKTTKMVRPADGGKPKKQTVFTYTIAECRQNRELMGEMFTSDELGEEPFATLASYIVPNTKKRDWRT
jgi:hypothetical protein